MTHLEQMVREYEQMLEQLEAERYTHGNESLAEVKRRVARERPDTPHQVLQRKRADAASAQFRQVQQVLDLKHMRGSK